MTDHHEQAAVREAAAREVARLLETPMADSDPHAETRALAPEQAARAVHDAIECIDAAVELLVYARTLRGVAHLRQARTLLEQALQRMTSCRRGHHRPASDSDPLAPRDIVADVPARDAR